MPRTATNAAKTAAADTHVRAIGLAYLDFVTGAVRVASTPFNILFDSDGDGTKEVFKGVGDFGKVSPVQEGVEIKSYSINFSLSGITNSLVTSALGEHYQGRPCKFWFGMLNSSYALIADPILLFSGLMDTMDISVGKTAEITLSAMSRLARWEQPINWRYNHPAQQSRFPSDLGLEFVEQMVEKTLIWPKNA